MSKAIKNIKGQSNGQMLPMKALNRSIAKRPKMDTTPCLRIRIQGIDGSVAIFEQNDPDLAVRTLEEINPTRILLQDKITIAGNHSVTTLIPPLITRVDLFSDRLSVWDFPFGYGAWLELTEPEFHQCLNERQRWTKPSSSAEYPTLIDIEMINGQHSFLWTEAQAELPTERLLKVYSTLKERSLVFGLRDCGIGVLNLANMWHFSVHPDPQIEPSGGTSSSSTEPFRK